MFPPHLPAQSCNVNNHRRWQRIKILLAITFLCVFAGMSGAAMMLGWIWPKYAEGDVWISAYNHPAMSKMQLEDRVREEMSARVVMVYANASLSVSSTILKEKVGQAILVSSDGWLAMYYPEYAGNYKSFSIIAADGSMYAASSALLDKYSGVLYLQIKGHQFKVVSFADAIAPDDVFSFQNQSWNHILIKHSFLNVNELPHIDTAPLIFYTIEGNTNRGEVVVNSQGRVVGFVGEKNTLLPSVYITRILPQVLSQQAVSYFSLGVDGWFSDEQPIVVNNQKIDGFAVARVLSEKNVLRKGDIILFIDGRVVAPDTLWYNINNNQQINLQVLRGGKIIDLQTMVTQAK